MENSTIAAVATPNAPGGIGIVRISGSRAIETAATVFTPIGGSPLTNAVEILTEKGLLEHTVAIGGMNLPLVLTAVFADEDESLQDVAREAMEESAQQIRQFTMSNDDEDDDI